MALYPGLERVVLVGMVDDEVIEHNEFILLVLCSQDLDHDLLKISRQVLKSKIKGLSINL